MAVIAFSAVGASTRGDLVGFAGTASGRLLDDLRDLGHEIVEPGDPRATHYVSLDHNSRALALVGEHIPASCRVLVVFEPRVVIPSNYRTSTRRHYGHVIGMSPAAAVPFLPWPQRDWRAHPPAVLPRVAGTTALINANKLSSIRGSLYGLRRRVIAQFDSDNLPLTLAGSGWDRSGLPLFIENARAIAYAIINREHLDLSEWAYPLPLSGSVDYIGRVDEKDDVLLGNEFAVIIENSSTYVSEKLFDAVIAGCVPLYVGPPLADYGIPENVVVALPPDPAAFTAAVRTLNVEAKRAVLAAGCEWLASDDSHEKWAMPHALARLAREINTSIRMKATEL